MMFLRFWRSLTKKDSVESAKYKNKKFLLELLFLDVFFMNPEPDFPDRIRIFGRSGLRKKV